MNQFIFKGCLISNLMNKASEWGRKYIELNGAELVNTLEIQLKCNYLTSGN